MTSNDKLGPQPFAYLFPLRMFRLRLRRSTAGFSPNFMVVSENGSSPADLSHIYSGILEGG